MERDVWIPRYKVNDLYTDEFFYRLMINRDTSSQVNDDCWF